MTEPVPSQRNKGGTTLVGFCGQLFWIFELLFLCFVVAISVS